MIGGLQGEEWKFIQKYPKEKISRGVGKNKAKFAPRMGCANFEGVVRISHNTHKPGAVGFRRPYLPHFSSKSYTVWSVRFLTSWALEWYIEYRKWTSESAPKVWKKTAAAVLWFFHFASLCFSLLLSFTWFVLMIQKAVKTLKLATNMIRSHC